MSGTVKHRERSWRPSFGEPARGTIGGHAVVLGASIGGLLATRVLSEAVERVTVVERDVLPEVGRNRRGVPQGRHAHALMPAGSLVLNEMFPGLLDDFEASGVPVVREPGEMHFAPGGHLLCRDGRYADPTPTYQPSRPVLEGEIRARVTALPNVEVIDRCEVVGLASSAGHDRVTGARIMLRDSGAEQTITSDLVVDATGRGGRATTWLAAMGYAQPVESRLAVDIKYLSRNLRLAPGALGRKKVVIVGAQPGRPTGATFLEHEDNRWMLTLIGYGGHHPPTDPDGFLEFAKSIVPPEVFDAIRDAEPLDKLVAHRYPASVRRRYERLARFPEGMLVFGDALCSFNPVYGQGMSVAALQAMALRDCLVHGPDHLARRFFRAAAKPIEVAYQMAVNGDLALPEVKGPRPLAVRVVNAYLGRLLGAAERDSALTQVFVQVSSLLAPPTALLHPSTIRRVLSGNLRRSRPFPAVKQDHSKADSTGSHFRETEGEILMCTAEQPRVQETGNELREHNRAVVEKYMATRGPARLERHLLFTEDGVGGLWTTETGEPIVIRGRDRLGEHAVWSLKCFPDWVWTDVEIFDTQDQNRFWVECHGVGKILFPGYPEGQYRNHFIHSFLFEDGKIKQQREFMNPCQQFRALGIPVPAVERAGIPT